MNASPILKLSSLNIGGLSRTKIDHLVMLAGGHPQVICLQETHSSSPSAVADLSQELANFRLFHSQDKAEKYAAVSILINRSWIVDDVKLAWKIEGRAIAMRIKVQNRLFLLVNTYAPAKPAKRVEFLEKLSEKLSNQQTIYDNIMIIGDFNFIEHAVLDRISTHNTA
ncbi:MAG: endonuclease/exonuclease/phosphatase family protein, partial [Endozoicomonas sp.]